MKEFVAFVDESGDANLETDKAGVSNWFIISAVIVSKDNLPEFMSAAENIRKTHFQTGEIKSSTIKDKDGHKRRIRILEEVLSLNFKVFTLAVLKSSAYKDSGLKYKPAFIKYINGILYNRLFKNYKNLEIYADEHGTDNFKLSMQRYIEKNHIPDLFWKSSFHIIKSSASVGVQLADIIVGTIAKIYEQKENNALKEMYIRLLKEKSLNLIEWPTKYQHYFDDISSSSKLDHEIHSHALAKSEVFLSENAKRSDEESLIQMCVLGYLAFKSRLEPSTGYISTNELLNHLKVSGYTRVSEQAIRSTVIAKLRDQDVIISSCNKGYKIPNCFDDLRDFVERVNSQVIPLLERLNFARKSYLTLELGIDMLSGERYPTLAELLETIDKKI